VSADGGERVLTPLRRARRRSLTDEVLEQLVELIAAGDPPFVRLPSERVLCGQLMVSRTALREALSALYQMGIVESRGNAKYGVPLRARTQELKGPQRTSEEQFSDAFEVRRMLEPQVAARAAERATPEAVGEIERWTEAIHDDVVDPDQLVDLDTGFHAAVARATVNPVAIQLVTALNNSARGERVAMYRNPGATAVARTGHARIMVAIRAGDQVGARRAMERHLRESERLLHRPLVDASPDEPPIAW
jgi:DNA-binding FadR family transcriptional regulator